MARPASAYSMALFLIVSTCALARGADVTSTLASPSGSTVNWSTATWSNSPNEGSFPNDGNLGLTFDAVIANSSTVALDQNITIERFTLKSSELTGGGNLTTNALFHLTDST